MRLYKDKALLNQAIAATARHFKADPAIVEKDYYATVFLKKLSGQLPGLVLTGSSALFKCHHVINRFSEDLDLTLKAAPVSKEQRRQVKKAVSAVCSDLGFSLSNEDDIKSRRDFNRYEIVYSPKKSSASKKPVFSADTDFTAKASPYESKTAASMIYEYMHFAGQKDFIRQYKLQPFPVSVPTMERTLCDGIFALCDSYLAGRISGQSYLIYDISRMIDRISLDESFSSLFKTVRAERTAGGRPVPYERKAGNGEPVFEDDACSIPDLLSEILEKEIFKKDYDSITARLIFDDISYEEASSGIRAVLAGGLLI